MRVELLYIPGCTNAEPAAARLLAALAEEGAAGYPMRRIAVRDLSSARVLRFPGSPTVRIDGFDVEPTESPAALACRRYLSDDRPSGVPAGDLRAISSALTRDPK